MFSASLDVSADVQLIGQLGDVDFESFLDVVENFGVGFVANESDGKALGAEAASARHAMEIRVRILRHVVVEDDVDALDVHAATEQVGRHQDTLLEIFELLIAGQPVTRKRILWLRFFMN